MAQVHPAGNVIPTLLTAAQPLLVTVNVSSVLVLPALVEIGLTIAVKLPRVVTGVEVDGMFNGGVRVSTVAALRVPVAEPLKVNGLVAPVEFT